VTQANKAEYQKLLAEYYVAIGRPNWDCKRVMELSEKMGKLVSRPPGLPQGTYSQDEQEAMVIQNRWYQSRINGVKT
jgi:hypothetical protein